MLKKFTKIKNSCIDIVDDIEYKYVIFSNYSYHDFTNIYAKISKFKIHSLLLLDDNNFYVKLRDLTCKTNSEQTEWNSVHSNTIAEILTYSKNISDLIYFSLHIEIISRVQYNFMKYVHILIINIFASNKIYYKDKFDDKGNKIIYDFPTLKEFNFYFNILEIIKKIFLKHFSEKDNRIHYDDILNDDYYLSLIEYINRKI